MTPPQPAPLGLETQHNLTQLLNPELSQEEAIIEKTLLAIQEKVIIVQLEIKIYI